VSTTRRRHVLSERDAVKGSDSLRRLRLRYPGTCSVCGIALSAGMEAFWDRGAKAVICLACGPVEHSLDAGVAGGSAAAEADERLQRRVEDVRRRHGDHAAHVAEQVGAREQSIASWRKGSDGESRLAAFVEREVGDRVLTLHDRLIPGTRRNIDHIFVARSGVWVVDAKSYKGKVDKRDVGPFWRTEHKVYVGGRDRSRLTAGVESQVEAVIAALRPDPALKGIDVYAALCFVDSEWGLLDVPFQVGRIWVLYPGALRKRLTKDGALSPELMERVAKRLALSLPAADRSYVWRAKRRSDS
jgi:Nuclease-related domain